MVILQIDASAIAVPAPASLDDKGIDMMTESPGSSSPVSVHMYVIDAVREASGGEVNRLGEFTELDAMCEKSWETRTDAKYELEVRRCEFVLSVRKVGFISASTRSRVTSPLVKISNTVVESSFD